VTDARFTQNRGPIQTHNLTDLDHIAADLRAQFPGWRIWYVTNLYSPPTWCGHPHPTINAGSVEQFVAEVREAHAEAPKYWSALSPEVPAPVPEPSAPDTDGPLHG
jgi:hypothetical protein